MTTPSPTPSAQWDSMTDQQKIEWLARNVMIWSRTIHQPPGYWIDADDNEHHSWNPLTDWNHWRQLEEKVMQNKDLYGDFVIQIIGHTTFSWNAVLEYEKSDLTTRAKTLFLALQ